MQKVLLVDDDRDILSLFKTYLEDNSEYYVDTADSFSTGLTALEKSSHDAYLFDYELDDNHTGLDLIKEGNKLGLAPMIMLTSLNDDRLAESVISSGGCDYICKDNLNMHHLKRAINNNICRSNRLKTLITERNSLLKKHQFDNLTGLVNRNYIIESLPKQLDETKMNSFAMLFIDLDGFKDVNDEYGHSAGDAVLKEVGVRLVNSVQQNDIVARMGGDEFLVCLTSSEKAKSARILSSIISSRINRAIAQTIKVYSDERNCEIEVSVSASIGVALYPEHSSDHELLIKMADQGMYKAKARGKNQFVIFHSDDPN